MKVPTNTFNAVMTQALLAYRREEWLLEASDMVDAGIAPSAAEAMRGFFLPFADRILAHATELPEGHKDKARELFFQRFSEVALS